MQGQHLSFFFQPCLLSKLRQRATLCMACFLSCKMSLWVPVSSISIWRRLSLDVILRAFSIASTESLQDTSPSPLPSASSHYEVGQMPLLKGMGSISRGCLLEATAKPVGVVSGRKVCFGLWFWRFSNQRCHAAEEHSR